MIARFLPVIVLAFALACSPQGRQTRRDLPVENGISSSDIRSDKQESTAQSNESVVRKTDETPLKYGVPIPDDPLATGEMKAHAKDAADLGWKYLKKGDYETAVRRFGMAIRHDSEYVDGYYGIAYAYSLKGDLTEAVNYYRKTLQKEPDHLYANANLGYALLQLGEEKEALEKLDKALSLNPDCGEAHVSYSNYYAKDGNWEQAGESARRAIELNQKIHPEFLKKLKSHGIELPGQTEPKSGGT